MKYKIKQHIGFKFRYPVHLTEDDIGKNKANGRCDRTDKVSVNVLVMAKDKKKNKKVLAAVVIILVGTMLLTTVLAALL